MPKATTYSILTPLLQITFNSVQPDGRYYPVEVQAVGKARTADGGQRDIVIKRYLGNLRAQPMTLREIYTLLNANSPPLASILRELVTEALSEDITI